MGRDRPEWHSDGQFARRHELYAKAAVVFHKYGYRGATLKALAAACGLSIPGLYSYFPSKRALALYPLVALYPTLHAPPPYASSPEPLTVLSGWVESAVEEMPNYTLAMRLAMEVGLQPEERRRVQANLAEHAALLSDLARRAAPSVDGMAVAWAMINLATGPALSGSESDPQLLRRQLQALLRGYGIRLVAAPRRLS